MRGSILTMLVTNAGCPSGRCRLKFKVISFDQALKAAQQYGKKHILLGNGFSIACKPDIFAYGSLFEEAEKTMSKELVVVVAIFTADADAGFRGGNSARCSMRPLSSVSTDQQFPHSSKSLPWRDAYQIAD